MIHDPISFAEIDKNGAAAEVDMTAQEFRVYAKAARWDDQTIHLLLCTPRPPTRFMCGGRMVLIVPAVANLRSA